MPVGQDLTEAEQWAKASGELAGYPTFQTDEGPIWVDVAGAPPIEYNIPVPLSAVFWGDDVGLDSASDVLEIALRTLKQIRVWQPHSGYLDSCIRPRLGEYRTGAPVGSENLLVSYQSIRIFPAVPSDCEIVMENFAAEGGFRVSAVRTAKGEVPEVRIKSTVGGQCRVANLWLGQGRSVSVTSDRDVMTMDATASHLTFPTSKGQTYLLRRN